jgi:tRNA(Arg) A34 adenosine deaminase TadA
VYVDAELTLESLEKQVAACEPNPGFPHDRYVIATLEEAVAATREGNFGVGAVIVNADGEIVMRGHNHVFHPYFRSDIHAEMDAMSKFEEAYKGVETLVDYTLFTSLEPCPMCLTRLITSGVGRVYHAAPDIESGMVSRLDALTPVWVDLAAEQEFAQAQCSPELGELALEVFLFTANRNTAKLLARRRPTSDAR